MRHWEIGVDVEQRTAAYCLEEAPWWVFALDHLVDWLCLHVPPIPLPNVDTSADEPTESIPVHDTRAWFHVRVHGPLGRWLEDQKQQFWLPGDYETVKQRHPAERRMIEELEDFEVEKQAA